MPGSAKKTAQAISMVDASPGSAQRSQVFFLTPHFPDGRANS
jgi:hypothetical protein